MGKIHRFLGFLAFICVAVFGATTASFAEEITLKWAPVYGVAPADTTCTYGETFDVPAGPVVEGRNFVSWTTNGQAFVPGQTGVSCTEDILGIFAGTQTFTGSFTPVYYDIIYELNGGTNSAYNVYRYNIDSPTIDLNDAIRNYSKFLGWYTNPNFEGSTISTIQTGSTGDVTVYAKWECKDNYNDDDNDNVCSLNTYTVNYACGTGATGTPPSPTTATYSETFVPAQNTCTHPNLQFKGWKVSGTEDVKTANAGFTWKYTEEKTLTAEWIETPGNCTIGQYYDSASSTCKPCPGGYTSDLGAEAQSQCYTTCQTDCIHYANNEDKPLNARNCTYQSGIQVDGVKYYGSEDCQTTRVCDYETVTCSSNFYFNGNLSYYNENGEKNTDLCVSCPIATEGSHRYSIMGRNYGINSCYAKAQYDCEPDLPSLIPELATCSLNKRYIDGVIYYPNPIMDEFIQIKPGLSCTVSNCSCPDGYTYHSGTPGSCDPNVYTITLDDNTGSGGDGAIYEKYTYGFVADPWDSTIITKISNIPEKATKVFYGYWDAPTGGTRYIDFAGNLPSSPYVFTEDKTLYAHWVDELFECPVGKTADNVSCTAGYYCPGETVIKTERYDEQTGCERKCPAHPDNGPGQSATGSDELSDCYSTTTGVDLENGTGGGDLVCNYVFNDITQTGEYSACLPINIRYCIAGYYYDASIDTESCIKVKNGYWSPAPTNNVIDSISMARYACSVLPGQSTPTTLGDVNALPTACYNTCSNENILNASNDVIGTRIANPVRSYFSGTISAYDATNGTVTTSGSYPVCTYDIVCEDGYHVDGDACSPNTYTITYDCGTENGGTAPTTNTTATYTQSFTPASVGGCNKTGHHFVGWKISDTNIVVNTAFDWEYKSNKTLVAQWEPSIYTITLNDGDKALTHGAPTPLYMKYGIGWYTDSTATNAITKLSQLPTRSGGYEFGSYTFGGQEIIDKTGAFISNTFTSANATLNIEWTAGKIDCPAGKYYSGDGSACDTCQSNYYCPGGKYPMYSGIVSGMFTCPEGGSSGVGADTVSLCHKVSDSYYATYGSGTQTCYYNSETGTYAGGTCSDNIIKKCKAGYYFNAEATSAETPDCVPVGLGFYSITDSMDKFECPSTHPYTNNDHAESIDDCYNSCPMSPNAIEMQGYYYHEPTHDDFCSIKTCAPGYYMASGACEPCTAGSYCNNNTITSCSALISGDDFTQWLYSDSDPDNSVLATSANDCYSKCEERPLTHSPDSARAYPDSPTVKYPATCTFKGWTESGNQCEATQVALGNCVDVACASTHEMINGVCTPCARDSNALVYASTGNCIIAECKNGFHPDGYVCSENVVDCHNSIPNASIANKTWNSTAKSFGICEVEECDDGYHVVSNVCVPNEQTCTVSNGVGTQTWNTTTNKWNPCIVTSCEAGYTLNDASTQCVDCPNKYKENGDLAVSSYVTGCEVASCMYQGEKYALKNGECEPICLSKTDGTGTRYWDSVNNKCVRTCSPGYINW